MIKHSWTVSPHSSSLQKYYNIWKAIMILDSLIIQQLQHIEYTIDNIYIYMCVCVCVSVPKQGHVTQRWVKKRLTEQRIENFKTTVAVLTTMILEVGANFRKTNNTEINFHLNISSIYFNFFSICFFLSKLLLFLSALFRLICKIKY